MHTAATLGALAPGRSRRVVSLEELHDRFGISYSRQHLHRRMQDGTFPKAVKLGSGKFARRVWLEDDVLVWLDQQREDSHGG